jgi:uncharacterized protein (TIRG00374 family)
LSEACKTMSAARRYKSWANMAALAAGALIFLGVLYSLGLEATWQALSRVRPGWLVVTVVFYLLSAYLRIYKWTLMRDRMRSPLTFSELSSAYFSSKFWGMVSPMRSGEVAPAVLRGNKQGNLLSIILYDRVIETFQSLIVFTVIFFLFYGTFWGMRSGIVLAGIFAALGVFVFFLVVRKAAERVYGWADGFLVIIGGRRIAAALRRFLQGLTGGLDEFYKATGSYFAVRFSLYNLFLTFVCWALDMAFWIALFRMMNVHTGLLITVASIMVYSLAAALAPIPGGLGVADLSFAIVLEHFGYKGEAGALIVAARVIFTCYVFLSYAATNPVWHKARE